MKKYVASINILAEFCGKRDINSLNQHDLAEKYGINQADVFVLFGGSILAGGDILAEAIKNNIAKKYIIVGGAGHTTQSLRDFVHSLYPSVITDNCSEANIFSQYLNHRYNLSVDYLEQDSTNCGNNIEYLLNLLIKEDIDFESVILCQDATMQFRMEATLKKFQPDVLIVNFASYKVNVYDNDGQLEFIDIPLGMWSMERYISLLLGEIPRLTDDNNGYGPNGKGYIAHVDVPEKVKNAFMQLSDKYGDLVRVANSIYATK